ncbi:MAG TPA: uracil-DNA glycosylase [Planctomycetota bacterium]|nr:uracil-DNA glycosylase [Planctomycetota bacterium]
MTSPVETSAREELASLAAGLAAHARRQAARGQRKSERADDAGALDAGRPHHPTPPSQPVASRAPAPLPRPVEAPRPVVPLLKDVLPQAAVRAIPTALDAAAIQAREIRARAQACTDLASLRAAVAECTACSLCKSRKQTVFMDGEGKVPIMFVGEAPGASEDEQGVPFVGRAGALLTDIITKGMGLRRADVVIANVLKCRPPENRDPSDVEKTLCTPWLDRQIELVDPKVLVPLGGHAAKHLLQAPASSLGALRARVHERAGRKVVPTFHPAYLLRSPGEKTECWKDIQLAMKELGLSIPSRAGNSSGGAG